MTMLGHRPYYAPLSPEAASFQGSNRLVLDGHLRPEPLQLQGQRLVVGAGRLMLRIDSHGRGEIRQRPRPIAFPAPEFAAGVEDIGKRWIEPQRGVVVADCAVDLVLA